MRDSHIVALHNRTLQRDSVILDQIENLKAWQQAFRMTIDNSGFIERIVWLFRPEILTKTIEAMQNVIIAKSQEQKQG